MAERGRERRSSHHVPLGEAALPQSLTNDAGHTSKPPLTPGAWMKRPSTSKKSGRISPEPLTRDQQHAGVSPEPDTGRRGRQTLLPQSAALHGWFSSSSLSGRGEGDSADCSDWSSPCSVRSSRHQCREECGLSQSDCPAQSRWNASRVGRTEAGQISQQVGGAGPPLSQTGDQAGDGLLFPGNGRANTPGLRGHEHASQGTDHRGRQRRYPRADHLRRPPVWSSRLSATRKGNLLPLVFL